MSHWIELASRRDAARCDVACCGRDFVFINRRKRCRIGLRRKVIVNQADGIVDNCVSSLHVFIFIPVLLSRCWTSNDVLIIQVC